MDYALAPARFAVLERFAGSPMLLALDFDGTLAPIVADPEEAAMRPSTRRLLREVAAAYPCIIISGRARADVLPRVRGLGVLEVIGNHGAEPGEAAPAVPDVRRWIARLHGDLSDLPGVRIEDKRLSLAVHYRRSRRKGVARARILAAAARLHDARRLRGKHVVNLLPLGAPHKGQALERVMARLGLERAVYVGDDETDEDVFTLGRRGRLLGIRVRRRAGSAAEYYIRTQAEIDVLLRRLLELRGGDRRRARRT